MQAKLLVVLAVGLLAAAEQKDDAKKDQEKLQGTWAVVDYGPLVVHIFQRAARDYYDLEMLWGDGRRIKWKSAERRASA